MCSYLHLECASTEFNNISFLCLCNAAVCRALTPQAPWAVMQLLCLGTSYHMYDTAVHHTYALCKIVILKMQYFGRAVFSRRPMFSTHRKTMVGVSAAEFRPDMAAHTTPHHTTPASCLIQGKQQQTTYVCRSGDVLFSAK